MNVRGLRLTTIIVCSVGILFILVAPNVGQILEQDSSPLSLSTTASVTFDLPSGLYSGASGDAVAFNGVTYTVSQLPVTITGLTVGGSYSWGWYTTIVSSSTVENVWESTSGCGQSSYQGTITVPSGGCTVSATYLPFFQVAFAVNPSGDGTVSWSGGCNVAGSTTTSYSDNYYYSTSSGACGTPLTVSYTNSVSGYSFQSWSTSGSVSVSGSTVTVNGPGTVTGNFGKPTASVTFDLPSGLYAGASGDAVEFNGVTYLVSQLPYTITGLPVGNSYSWGWYVTIDSGSTVENVWDTTSGCGQSSYEGTITVPSGGCTVSATYLPMYQVTFAVNPSGDGTVSWSGGCNAYASSTTTSYSGNFYYSTAVCGSAISLGYTNSASGSGYYFQSWSISGSVSVSGSSLTVNGVGAVTGNFATSAWTFSVSPSATSGTSSQSGSYTLSGTSAVTSGNAQPVTCQLESTPAGYQGQVNYPESCSGTPSYGWEISFAPTMSTPASSTPYDFTFMFTANQAPTQTFTFALTVVAAPAIELFSGSSYSVPTNPTSGTASPFVEYLYMENTGGTSATVPGSVRVVGAAPTTDADGDQPQISCVPQNPTQVLQPNVASLVAYNCIAWWNYAAPPSLLETAEQAYLGLAEDAASDIAQKGAEGVLSYAGQELSGAALTGFEAGWDTSWDLIGSVSDLAGGIADLIQLLASGEITLDETYSLSVYSPYSVSTPNGPVQLTVIAPESKFAIVANWAQNDLNAALLSLSASVLATAALPLCTSIIGCAVPGVLYAISALAGPVSDALQQDSLSDPNSNYTQLVSAAPLPSGFLGLGTGAWSHLFDSDYYLYADLEASVESVARGLGALDAGSEFYAVLQYEQAQNFALQASEIITGVTPNLESAISNLVPLTASDLSTGLGLLNASGLPSNLSTLMDSFGITGYLNLTHLESETPGELNGTTISAVESGDWNLGQTLSVEVSSILGLLGTPLSENQSAFVENGSISFPFASDTNVSVVLSGSPSPNGTTVSIETEELPGQPSGTSPLSSPSIGFWSVNVTGLTYSAAQVCISNVEVASASQMYYDVAGSWYSVQNQSTIGQTICGWLPENSLSPAFIAVTSGTLVTPPPETFAVTFEEEGLVSGTLWSVTLNGSTDVTQSNLLTIDEPNGTFEFDIGGVTGYFGSPGLGNVTVDDAAVSVPLQFYGAFPSIAVGPKQGPVGASVSVTGYGFTLSQPVLLNFDGVSISSCLVGSLTSNSTGNFTCTFEVPAGTSGTEVTADDVGGAVATASFIVTVPSITVTPGQGPLGSIVNITGSGFSISSSVDLEFDNLPVSACSVGSLLTTSFGTFSCSLAVPTGTSGTTVLATDVGGAIATALFTVTSLSITLSPSQGPVGAMVIVSGSGFSLSSTVSIVFDGVSVSSCTSGSLTTNGTGSFDCTVTVPGGTSGSSVTATDVGGTTATATFKVTAPKITLSPKQGPVGATVTITGTGFSVSSTVVLVFDGVSISSCSVGGGLTTNSAGKFTCALTTPSGTSGSAVTATDVGGERAAATFKVTTPKITVNPKQGPVGATVTVTGSGFSLTSTVGLSFDALAIPSCSSGSLTTSGTGSFSCSLSVPSGTTGTSVVATDVGGTTATATFKVTAPKITLSPKQGPVGATVTITGTGFSVSSTVVLVFDGVSISSCSVGGGLTTNSAGKFTCGIIVPSGTSGKTVTATDVGGQQAAATFKVTTPKITVNPKQGPVGATVTVTGSGFSVSSAVSLTFDAVAISSCTSGSLVASSSGAFSCTFAVPTGTSGSTVIALDVGGAFAKATFTVTG